MALEIENLGVSALELSVDGKLAKDDYRKFVPYAEELIRQHGRIDLLIHVSNLKGWTPAAMWEDIKFDARHYRDVSRIALVAENESRRWLAVLTKPFTAAKVEFFLENELEQARAWVTGTETAQ